ncbi:tRNA pseudouridine(38-40) synthase TruA [Virgibacillus phasianinus]|uniref:tRNA pseudouridine synthase A n=1 Tax=Virgibacillus phasianinus TaxID=2017483 RepID=A0A220U0U5_9BACI|nr:tRNA pseudouridine(38-40) synthase TruA [Virgibacillus phasianinus]ASK61625.1 tRNA pseudouridine(38-40) synthase TruA [Virgibacillus phasianinus]
MGRIKCVISYDGTNFSGFQIQPKTRTVHGELEKALKKMHKGEPIRIHASGRTDTGVHAKRQTIHFDTPYDIPYENWKRALNTLLPADLYVREVEEAAASFHARYDVCEKEYRYYVWNEKEPDVFKHNYAYHFPYTLDISAIQSACKQLEGEHDFTTFSSAKATTKGSKVRTLYQVSCSKSGSEIEFIFRGSGFLYNMVRIIVGAMLDVGQGRRRQEDIGRLLTQKDRQLLGETVPAQGLYLWNVKY